MWKFTDIEMQVLCKDPFERKISNFYVDQFEHLQAISYIPI